ncbi:hypothetical protein [Streptomyces sp. NPDC090093]|uniref:hypothetical protein n=1 Tax=Streptomyces sp. NPDC090093 TaxID=3365945 RepID=UPI00381A45D4
MSTENGPAGSIRRGRSCHGPLLLLSGPVESSGVLGRVGDAKILYDQSEADFSPSNLWAKDRSWVLCTDYDLWGTKVAGPPDLINALLNGSEIEAVRLPWAH